MSAAAGEIYEEKLLALPPFLRGEARFENADILDGLKLTGHFFLHRVFAQANENLPDARLRLEERFSRLVYPQAVDQGQLAKTAEIL